MPRPDPARRPATTGTTTGTTTGPSRLVFIGVIAAAVIVAVVIAVFLNRPESHQSYDGAVPAGGSSAADGINPYHSLSLPTGVPTVEVYEDFQCPFCKDLETANGDAMLAQAKAGKIRLIWHPVTFLEDNLKNAPSSTIATNGLYCAADAHKAGAYHRAAFAGQPEKEGAGFSVADIKKFGRQAGIDGAARTKFDSCVDKVRYNGFVSATADNAGRDGVNSTPSVFIDGEELSPTKNSQEYGKLLKTPDSFDSVLASMEAK
ncbi:DsbA family protein [Flexivirga sp. B27]